MKAITIHVSEVAYQEFQKMARREDCSAAELIRQSMEEFRRRHSRPSLKEFDPFSSGRSSRKLSTDNLLDEMLHEAGR